MQLSIPITKAKKAIVVDTEKLFDVLDSEGNPEMIRLVFQEGLKVILNKGMTGDDFKTTGLEGADLEKVQESCYDKALDTFDKLMKGELKVGRGASSADGTKIPATVLTEAKRLAKGILKDSYRNRTGKSPSQVAAAQWTKAAGEYIKDHPELVEEAKANIQARKAKVAPKVEAETDDAEAIAAAEKAKAAAAAEFAALGLAPDPKIVAKNKKDAEDRKRERQLSKTQAGIVKPRKAKPSAGAALH